MKIDGVSIRVGNILNYEGKLWGVTKTMHTQPGKGGAYMQVEMKDIVAGTKKNVRFRSDETVERVSLEEHPAQFMYADGDVLHFMDNISYEQIEIQKDLMDEIQVKFLREGGQVTLEMHDSNVLSVKLPDKMEFEVVECDVAIKNQTAASSYKPAILSNGVKIQVPPFIESGD
jgi:elongation factor P